MICVESCLQTLKELQNAALENLSIREAFNSTCRSLFCLLAFYFNYMYSLLLATATFKVKVPQTKDLISITGHLTDTGHSLLTKLAQLLNLFPEK